MTDWLYTYDGFSFGTGTSVDVVGTEGLEDLPPLRTANQPRPGRHGEVAGLDLSAGRTVTFELELFAATDAAARALVDDLQAATTPRVRPSALTFQHPGAAARMVLVRPRRRSIPQDLAFSLNAGRAVVEFYATDPLIYSSASSSGSTGFPTGGTGRTYARTSPRVYGASGTGGVVSATNDGTAPVGWVATIDGPWTNPTIRNVGTGQQLTINVTLTTGETLTVDSAARSILLGGTASRFSSLVQPASWFDLEPGVTEVRFGGAAGSGTAELSWRSGWL